jgi:RNA polymerase sigma factor (sigma-70 family)
MDWKDMTEKERNNYIFQDNVRGYNFIPGIYSFTNMDFVSNDSVSTTSESEKNWWSDIDIDSLEDFWGGTTEKQKIAVSKYFSGSTQKEIGKEMKISKQAVSRLVKRGVKRLRKKYKNLIFARNSEK